MIAVEFRLRISSMYSIRVPYSYQCARTYPLPAPSTIKGLCANALWRKEGGNPVELMGVIHNASLGATSRSELSIAVSSCTVRVVPLNALLRQFAFTPCIDCMIVLKEDDLGRRIADALKVSPVYLGDSESLVTVIAESVSTDLHIEEINEGKEIAVNSLFKFDFIRDKKLNQKCLVLYMQTDPFSADAVLERYIAPLKQEGDSYKPLDSISFVSAQKGLFVTGERVQGIFCEDKPAGAVTQGPSRGKRKKA